MPVKRRAVKERVEDVSPVWMSLFYDESPVIETETDRLDMMFYQNWRDEEETMPGGLPSPLAVWRQVCEDVLAEWVSSKPGTRPWHWWRWSAPEPRRDGEAELAYLRRHNLLLPGERARSA